MPQKPNIIFIFADQLRSHSLGCYGNHQVKTPNINRLAEEGLKFSNAISTHPVCGPYRGMLMTGNFPIKNGVIFTDHMLKNPDPYFAEVCKGAGYETGYIGKWHLDGRGRSAYIPPERRLGFDYFKALECTHNYDDSPYYDNNDEKIKKWEQYDAIAQTEDACEYIIQHKDNPFCLFLSWGPPHDPYEAPPKYMERFRGVDIDLRENVTDFATAEKMWTESDTVLPKNFLAVREEKRKLLKDPSNQAIIEWHRGYYAAIEALDDCMGNILRSLESSGQLDNSIVVFTSDHGDSLGSHRQAYKQMPFEESISIPLLIRYPEKFKDGMETDALLAPQDLMPTLLALADLDCHEVDGINMLPEITQEIEELQDAVLINKSMALSMNWITNGNGPWCGVRTKRYTYARLTNSNKPWLLFDNLNDPFQLKNLIDEPEYLSLQNQMDQLTDELLASSNEPGDPKVYAKIAQEERNALGLFDRWGDLCPEVVRK